MISDDLILLALPANFVNIGILLLIFINISDTDIKDFDGFNRKGDSFFYLASCYVQGIKT